MPIVRLLTTCFMLAFSITGCGAMDTTATRNLSTPGQPFYQALYIQYAELFLRDVEEGNTVSAKIYHNMSLLTASGVAVPAPVIPEEEIPVDRLKTVQAGNHEFDNIPRTRAISSTPEVYARAQAMLDCWIEELSQNVDAGDIAACQQAFERAIAVLSAQKRHSPTSN